MKIEIVKQKLNSCGLDAQETNFVLTQVLDVDLSKLLVMSEIDIKSAKKCTKIAKKMQKGMPLNLIFKKQNFFGRDFITSKKVLKPRLDSEILVAETLKIAKSGQSVLDLCCGSGIVGITLNLEKNMKATLCDISKYAIKLSKKNAKALGADVAIYKSDMFKNVAGKFDFICINPPYIKSGEIEKLDDAVKKFDPLLALDGGDDGLKFYRIIEKEFKKFLNKNGVLLLEIGFDQAKEVQEIFKNFKTSVVKDFGGNDRVVIVKEA